MSLPHIPQHILWASSSIAVKLFAGAGPLPPSHPLSIL
jgi:hypothetical protein